MTSRDQITQLIEEWHRLQESGSLATLEEFAARFPGHEEELLRRMRTLSLFDRAIGESTASRRGVTPAPPRRIGEFELLREIGVGGMGVVYEAEQSSMSRRVALKVLRPNRFVNKRAITRFRREAQTAGRLHHTNVVPVYSFGEEGGAWYYAMELVKGRGLDEVLATMQQSARSPRHRSKAWSGEQATADEWFREVAEAFAGVGPPQHRS